MKLTIKDIKKIIRESLNEAPARKAKPLPKPTRRQKKKAAAAQDDLFFNALLRASTENARPENSREVSLKEIEQFAPEAAAKAAERSFVAFFLVPASDDDDDPVVVNGEPYVLFAESPPGETGRGCGTLTVGGLTPHGTDLKSSIVYVN